MVFQGWLYHKAPDIVGKGYKRYKYVCVLFYIFIVLHPHYKILFFHPLISIFALEII